MCRRIAERDCRKIGKRKMEGPNTLLLGDEPRYAAIDLNKVLE
jgi:hypothetical protein